MRRALIALLLAGCAEPPSYEGRQCNDQKPCPFPYACVAERCTRGLIDPDGGDVPATDGGLSGKDATPNQPCSEALEYPSMGWAVRHHDLLFGRQFGECRFEETIATQTIDRDFGSGGVPGIGSVFASSYGATRNFGAGVHTITVQHDDGLRIYLDDHLLLDAWDQVGFAERTVATPHLTAGDHRLRLEHNNQEGASLLRMTWEPGCSVEVDESAWTVSYYGLDANDEIDRTHCYGTERRTNLVITGDPAMVADLTQYAIVAARYVVFPGSSRIDVEYGDGLRVFVDGTLRLDDWNENAEAVDDDVTLYLPPTESHPVVIEKLTKSGERILQVDIRSRCGGSVVGPNLWHAVYYAVVTDGVTWTLDRGHCLGTAVINSTTLMEAGTPAVVSALGITGYWGADYSAQRSFAALTTVSIVHDDGLRVFDGGSLIYEAWTAPNVTNTTLTIGAGNHNFRLEYFQELGGAQVQFTY